MEKLSALSLKKLLGRLSSREPAPGGGSASAMACAMAASLLVMAAGVTLGKAEADESLKILAGEAGALKETSLSLVEEDSAAYLRVVEAYRMPKETEAEKKARALCIRESLEGATEVPVRIEESALAVLRLAAGMATLVKAGVVCDLGVGVLLAETAFKGAMLNVAINLKSSKNKELTEKYTAVQEEIFREARFILDELKPFLNESLGLPLDGSLVQL